MISTTTRSWWGDDGHRDDTLEHGTHVAGIIAAEAGNGVAGAGVAPQASIVSLKIHLYLPDEGTAPDQEWFFSLAGAIEEARRAGAKVVNMSIKMLDDDEKGSRQPADVVV